MLKLFKLNSIKNSNYINNLKNFNKCRIFNRNISNNEIKIINKEKAVLVRVLTAIETGLLLSLCYHLIIIIICYYYYINLYHNLLSILRLNFIKF